MDSIAKGIELGFWLTVTASLLFVIGIIILMIKAWKQKPGNDDDINFNSI